MDKNSFLKHLDRCSEIVKTWTSWKRRTVEWPDPKLPPVNLYNMPKRK